MAATQIAAAGLVVVSTVVAVVATRFSDWVLPSVVVITAVLVLPIVIRALASLQGDDPDLD